MEDVSADIITKAAQGDQQAFAVIYKAMSGFVYTLAYRVLRNATEAEEVTQEVFISMYHHLKDFQFRSSLKTWVYRVATNCALNAYRRRSREQSRRGDFEIAEATVPSPHNVHAQLDQKDREALINQMLEILSPDQRACIVLREIQGLSYQEIADALQVNINTVRTRLKRAREALVAHGKSGVIHHEL